jgi:hypothetical protein
LSCCVNIAKILSNHIPNPDCGGIPYSIEITKSLSSAVASSSHFAAASFCASKFACWNIGSTSSEYALHISRPFTSNWNCSTTQTSSSDTLAKGCIITG